MLLQVNIIAAFIVVHVLERSRGSSFGYLAFKFVRPVQSWQFTLLLVSCRWFVRLDSICILYFLLLNDQDLPLGKFEKILI